MRAVALLVLAALVTTAAVIVVTAYPGPYPPHWRDWLNDALGWYVLLLVVLFTIEYAGTPQQLTISETGITVGAPGSQLSVRWDEILKVAVVRRDLDSPPAGHRLVAWARDEATDRWRRRLRRNEEGGHRLCTLDSLDGYFSVSVAEVDAALRRYAGNRYRSLIIVP